MDSRTIWVGFRPSPNWLPGALPDPASTTPEPVTRRGLSAGTGCGAYWAQAQALGPESAQICDAIWLCSDGDASCGEPLPPYRRQVDGGFGTRRRRPRMG